MLQQLLSATRVLGPNREVFSSPTQTKRSWGYLPDTLFRSIVQNVASKDLAAMQLTCSSWRNAMGANLASLRPLAWNGDVVLARFSHISCLDLSYCTDLSEFGLLQLLKFSKLKELRIVNCKGTKVRAYSRTLHQGTSQVLPLSTSSLDMYWP
jgi:hypothetical protein